MRAARFSRIVLVVLSLAVAVTPAAFAATGSGLRFTKPIRVVAHPPIGTLLGDGERQPSGEPSIKVDSKGVIYIAGVTSVGQASPIWVSTNGGRSFEEVTTPLNWRETSPYGAEGDIAIDTKNRMYFADTAIPVIPFSRWAPPQGPDDQPSWEYTYPHTAGVTPGFDDRPWLAYGGTGDDDESLWLYVNHVAKVSVYRSTDDGLTWNESTTTLPEQRFFPGHVAAPRRNSQTAYLFGNCGDNVSLCSRSTHDGGATWKESQVAKTAEGREIGPIMVNAAVDNAGTVYGVWSEAGKGCDVFYSASTDGGSTWRRKVRVDGARCGAFPWITAGDRGRIAIAWYEASVNGPHPDQVPADAKWFLKAAVITSAASRSPTITRGTADPNPVHIGPLARNLWDYLQIATGPDGRFHIAYAEDVGEVDGPVGTGVNPSNGTNHKNTMYVAQSGGPRLTN